MSRSRLVYLVTTEDRMIPPPAQREMSAPAGSTVVEVAGSHAIYASQPAAEAELIQTAVNATTLPRSAPRASLQHSLAGRGR
jgi:hypothetical protein